MSLFEKIKAEVLSCADDEHILVDDVLSIVDQALDERRERIATAAMAGILANSSRIGNIKEALRCADALIAELDKERTE